MATRTSFELYPGGCRLVEVDLPPRRSPAAADARVRTFVNDVGAGDDPVTLANTLLRLKQERKLPRQAWVTVWGLRAVQQFLRLPPATPAVLESLAAREARKDIAPLETGGDRASVAIVLGGEIQVGSHRRREVSLVAVSTTEVRQRIQPLVDAGFIVEGVLTPALALAAVARGRADTLPGTAAAYVALTATATCVAIVRDGVVLFAREMPWGHDGHPSPAGGDALGARLASELKRSVLFFKQTFRASVDAVVLCGDMPNLRALTAPLGAALEVPVETLDSLVGIDAAHVPEPADAFRAQVGALRLAIATGADAMPSANLLPATIRLSRDAQRQMVRLAGGLAASLLLVAGGYVFVERSASGHAAERTVIEHQLATLEPEARRLDALREAFTVASARQAALGAFESQGPRLARVLEALSAATPDEIVLTGITADADGLAWHARVTGVAITEDAGSGQAAVNSLIDSVSESPFVGEPIEPPSLRVVSGRGGASSASVSGTTAPVGAIPDGMSGVEFVLQFRLPR
jgi:Tfp pilus assembly protein PilN